MKKVTVQIGNPSDTNGCTLTEGILIGTADLSHTGICSTAMIIVPYQGQLYFAEARQNPRDFQGNYYSTNLLQYNNLESSENEFYLIAKTWCNEQGEIIINEELKILDFIKEE